MWEGLTKINHGFCHSKHCLTLLWSASQYVGGVCNKNYGKTNGTEIMVTTLLHG